MIGYLLAQALRKIAALTARCRRAAEQVVVDPDRPGVRAPDEADRPGSLGARRTRAWHETTTGRSRVTALTSGGSFRRRSCSAIGELEPIKRLVRTGAVVICLAAGACRSQKKPERAWAVPRPNDKDLTAALLAKEVGAERGPASPQPTFPLWKPAGARVRLRRFLLQAQRSFAPWSSRQARWPRRSTRCAGSEPGAHGATAAIGSLKELDAVIRGRAGTQIAARRLALATA